MLKASPGCCEESAMGVGGGYIPCNRHASFMVRWKGRSEPAIRMCTICTEHNLKNRNGEIADIVKETKDA